MSGGMLEENPIAQNMFIIQATDIIKVNVLDYVSFVNMLQ